MSFSIILEDFLKKENININYFIKKDEININDRKIYRKGKKTINYFIKKNQKFLKKKIFYEKNKIKIQKIQRNRNRLKKICGLNIYIKKRKKELVKFLRINKTINNIYKRKNYLINVKIFYSTKNYKLIYNFYKNLILKKKKIIL
jgi:hypothetical protein